MDRENEITAAILGELVPELEYAAPLLLERSDRGEPLVGSTSQTDIGFEPGAVDSVLLELFKALVPHVKLLLSWGMLRVIQAWLSSERETRRHTELLTLLTVLVQENGKLRQMLERIALPLAQREGEEVSVDRILQSVVAAVRRVGNPDVTRGRE